MKNPRMPPNQLSSDLRTNKPTPTTFSDHVQELRSRLFWIGLVFVAASAAAYPFFVAVMDFLTWPLGEQQLFYLTPIGGLSFIIKVCMAVGAFLTVPAIVYHMYRYLQPVIGAVKRGTVALYVSFSALLAALGVAFAYFVSLPAALRFLTDFNIEQISAMLTVDSYFSFVMTYLFAAALLFQLPLVLLIINSATPLTPSGLMKYQRHVILVAFVAAALISPTPDVMNQAMLAIPVIAMYQIGIALVFCKNTLSKRPKTRLVQTDTPSRLESAIAAEKQSYRPPMPTPTHPPRRQVSLDGVKPHRLSPQTRTTRYLRVQARPAASQRLPVARQLSYPSRGRVVRSIDGFAINM